MTPEANFERENAEPENTEPQSADRAAGGDAGSDCTASAASYAQTPPTGGVRSALLASFRLGAPAAAAAAVVALFARTEPSATTLAIGVGVGVLSGAAVASLFSAPPSSVAPPRARARADAAPKRAPRRDAPAQGHEWRVLERIPTPLMLLDRNGFALFANAAAAQELSANLVGRHFSTALRAPNLVEAVNRAYSEREGSRLSFASQRAHERHWFAHVEPLAPAPDGAAPGGEPSPEVLILIEDHTRARRAEQLHRDFVANASHELKTPLTSIAGFIETLQGPAKGDLEAQDRFLEIMARQAARMRQLVEDLLSLNRIELREHVAPRDLVDLETVLEDAAGLALTADARSSDDEHDGAPRIDIDVSQSPPPIYGDRGELLQMVENLLSNALKYGGEKHPVRVSIDVDGDRDGPTRVVLSVADSGPGIGKEHLPRLTERFYRAETSSTRRKSGTGLGLAIVKHVVARHRGELSIASELGRGSTFAVSLPAAVLETPHEAQASTAPRRAAPMFEPMSEPMSAPMSEPMSERMSGPMSTRARS